MYADAAERPYMKILVVSGFLGAGKTTFIKSLTEHTGKEFAILENEYGEVGIDGDLLKEQQKVGEVNIWELTEGCICCSMKGDFAASVLTIANTVDPEYLVIEPTGVGMLSNIAENLRQIEYERISLLAPVTIVDGRSFWQYLREYPEIYQDQIRAAKTVLVSKMESASPEERQKLEGELRKQNPSGVIRTEHYSKMEKEEWLDLLRQKYDGTCLEERKEETAELPDTFSMNGIQMDSPELLIVLLENLIHGQFGNIVRAKGCIQAGGQWFRFDAADGRYSIIGADDAGNTESGKAVFIGREICRQKIRRYFVKKRMRLRLGQKTVSRGKEYQWFTE